MIILFLELKNILPSLKISVYENAYPDYYTYSTVTGYNDIGLNTTFNWVYITGLIDS